MHHLFIQTLGVGAGEGNGDEALNLFGLFDDSFDVNPSVDDRKADQLVCPTCMRVN
eukprot:CAMPEP_0201970974 /NCGR_PEP_ID=MMETSP0904-20121228/34765_1 /ASSEMBLY_ACC=CAM_ASM_000553 /TAXON_ID=420261 /ORGANISM="Thalassiosira antarctica, Strain CCMP982" /LENGTH=55 /DNA_ID=CAMNT_0048520201 /DNA_START=217 /DNA_END=381 /DNA_ORIENTATION=-